MIANNDDDGDDDKIMVYVRRCLSNNKMRGIYSFLKLLLNEIGREVRTNAHQSWHLLELCRYVVSSLPDGINNNSNKRNEDGLWRIPASFAAVWLKHYLEDGDKTIVLCNQWCEYTTIIEATRRQNTPPSLITAQLHEDLSSVTVDPFPYQLATSVISLDDVQKCSLDSQKRALLARTFHQLSGNTTFRLEVRRTLYAAYKVFKHDPISGIHGLRFMKIGLEAYPRLKSEFSELSR